MAEPELTDRVHIDAPPGIRPMGAWWDLLLLDACRFCYVEVHARYQPPGLGSKFARFFEDSWQITVVHEPDCLMATP